MNLNQILSNSMKTAMKEKNKSRLGTIRLIRADIKRAEIEIGRILEDHEIFVVLDKMLKQRRDSMKQYESAGRHELARAVGLLSRLARVGPRLAEGRRHRAFRAEAAGVALIASGVARL